MTAIIYSIVLGYFFIGGILLLYITRNKDSHYRKSNWIKYITYFAIVNFMLLAILFFPSVFQIAAFGIIIRGFYELVYLQKTGGKQRLNFFIISLLIFSLLTVGFLRFSFLNPQILLYVYFIITVSDAFSQLTGQIAGKRKLLPSVSPNKTLEGVIGGITASAITSVMIREALAFSYLQAVCAGAAVSVIGLFGDLAASYYKRFYNVKDFPLILPGHGGFLDRFDSFIAAGAFTGFYYLIQG